ncbi:MAG: SDR family oxidoreductase [Thermoleophilaceae bacterium]
MEVLVAGGHGKVGRRLLRALSGEGHRARGLIRNSDQAGDLEEDGAEAVVLDLEQDSIEDVLTDAVSGADAVVFAAGAGPGSGAERKSTMDFGGAVKLMDAAKAAGVRRYVMVSSMGADDPESASGPMIPYLEAKAAADRALEESGLDYTIVRPGGLTDDPGTGRIDAATTLGRRGQIPRDDVAQTLLATLFAPTTIGKTFEVLSGDTPIQEAVRSV